MGYLNGLNLKVSESKYAGYSIKFDLEFRRGGTVEESEQKAQKEKLLAILLEIVFPKETVIYIHDLLPRKLIMGMELRPRQL